MTIENDHIARQLSTYSGTNRNGWSGLKRATDWDAIHSNYKVGTYATSNYSWKKGVLYKPQDLRGYDFNFDLPKDATPINLKLYLHIRVTGSSVKTPSVKFNLVAPKHKNLNNTKSYHETGWHNGYYVDGTGSYKGNTYISTGWWLFEYEMPYSELSKGGYDYTTFNKDMGVDVRFRDGNGSCGVQLAYMYMRLEYVQPNHQIKFVESPAHLSTGEEFNLDVKYTQSEPKAVHGGNITFDVLPQWGEEILSYSLKDSGQSYDSATKKWTVNSVGKQSHTMSLGLKSHVIEDNVILFHNSKCGFTHHSYLNYGVDGGYDNIRLSTVGTVKQNVKSYMLVAIEGYSSDSTATYVFDTDNVMGMRVVDWDVSDETPNVSIKEISNDKKSITLNVPTHERFTAYLLVTFVPYGFGETDLTIYSDDTHQTKTLTIDIVEGLVFHVTSDLNKKDTDEIMYLYCPTNKVVVQTGRVLSDIESGTSILPFRADPVDSLMTQSDIKMHLNKLEDLDYIGCVPLEQTHFDPKSTYKDTLLNTNYKNKRYMGKKLASDEDITLNVRLHPKDVTTIQGLIDMDKPIPINANHRCFEGDSLNHRGWCEIYAIKTEQTGNNPHWYKCDIDVKYLTHNLNTRLAIERGNKVSDYPLSDVMYSRLNYGDTLSLPSDATNLTDDDFFFKIATDGTYEYIEDVDPSFANIFNLNNGEHLALTSRDKLANMTRIGMEWSSVLLDEIKENNISRIIKLVDTDGNSVFEYEYTNFEFSYDTSNNVNNINADVVFRIRTVTGWENINDNINLRMLLHDSSTGVTVSADTSSVGSVNAQRLYGSTLHFELENNKLKVIDEGFNGREVHTENAIELMDGDYYFVTEWKNNNSDAETDDVTAYMNFSVEETMITSDFATKYSKCVTSPFPVAKKHMLFTRDGEEGTLYYYEDDGEEFSYLIEPYYIYQNGTDLKSSDGTSIFNLNYGYEIVYIQNGLVRMGFNRINGEVYLAKYDPKSNIYITTHNFRLEKYSDINTRSISDDKIEIQASDTIFTIWRGHPYIMITHPTEDILIDTRFNRVWAEGVGSNTISEYPIYWDLLNTSNLLPPCVGGVKEMDKSCLEVSEEDVSRTQTTLEWDNFPSHIYADEDTTFAVKSATGTGRVSNPTDDITLDYAYNKSIFGDYTVEFETNPDIPCWIHEYGDKQVISPNTSSVFAKVTDYDGNPINNVTVNFYEEYEVGFVDFYTNKTFVNADDPSTTATFTSHVHDIDESIVIGGRVNFEAEFETPNWNIDLDGDEVFNGSNTVTATVTDSSDNPQENVLLSFYEDIPVAPTEVRWDLISSNNVQKGQSISLSATLYDANNHRYVNDEYVELVDTDGTVLSRAKTSIKTINRARFTYTGRGDGIHQLRARWNHLQSDVFELLDSLYYDNANSDKTASYTKSRCSLELGNNQLIATKTSAGDGYAEYRPSTVDDYIGNTIYFGCNILEATDGVRLSIYQQVNNSWSEVSPVHSDYVTSGNMNISADINQNATGVRIRLDLRNVGANGTCKFKDFKVYLI